MISMGRPVTEDASTEDASCAAPARAGRMRPALVRAVLAGGVLLGAAAPAAAQTAQNIQTYFPPGNAGYDQELGVTVLTRLRPLYESPGVQVGSFTVYPSIDQSLLYNSNLNGTTPSVGSWGESTSAAISANSNWVRDALNFTAGVSDNQFFELPGDNFVNWNVGLSGGYTINDSLLRASYAHQTFYTLGTTIATTVSQAPVENQIDTGDLTYTFNFGNLAIIPDLNVSAYSFGPALVNGRLLDQSFLNRNVVAGGVDGRYSLSDEGSILVVARGVVSDYTAPQPGQPSNNSDGFEFLGGLDYQGEGVWRYRLLVGAEKIMFQAFQYASQTAPIAEASVIWTPTGLTTVTASLSREIEDPTAADTIAFLSTGGSLVLDHELMPNVFLEARGSDTYVQYLDSGGQGQNAFSAGAGATWLLSRNFRLMLNYDFIKQTGLSGVATTGPISAANPLVNGAFVQHLVMLTLHVSL